MSPRERRTKVAVLGGGPAGLTAAFELTDTPELRSRYDVTVYQLGWRLGGKCASGRNAAHGQRIEEHGLHLWFGFYDNAFALMQRCYEELGRPDGAPLAAWDQAFTSSGDIVLYEQWGERWIPRRFDVPGRDGTPGRSVAGEETEPSVGDFLMQTLRFLREQWDERSERFLAEPAGVHSPSGPPSGGQLPLWTWPVVPRVDRDPLALRRWGRAHLLELAERAAAGALRTLPGLGADVLVPRLLDAFRDWLWEAVVEDRVDDDETRFAFMAYDFVAGVITGIYRDRLLERGFGVINDEEFTAWLERHGVTRLTLEHAPFVRGFYSLVFGFDQGDTERRDVAAGKALQACIRMAFCYRGAFVWKMWAGMGDAVITPLYEVLRRRGVTFRFFHPVTRLHLSRDRQSVSSIVVQPQVELAGGRAEYEPLVDVKGLPCWPSEPGWDQIENGAALRDRGVDLEHDLDPSGLAPLTLRRGRDFDVAVLAIPVGALGPICTELAADPANPRFGRMLAGSRTVATQAFQLWMTRPLDELGWPHGPFTVTSSYVEPLDTYCDMSHLVGVEDWPAGDVAGIAYFCGVLPDRPGQTDAEADAAARAHALDYLRRHAGRLWPGALDADGVFQWKLLVDGQDRSGEDRFDAQYCRANFGGTDRYVTTPAGSVTSRLRADESGYRNLVLAGDWTRNGISGGCVEAAVTSGMQASRAVCGRPEHISGENGILERD